jgi:catechol 2,3-dioxygenase-like lactoylglutathione lyase family enzyme
MITLNAPHLGEAVRFYVEVLGMKLVAEKDGSAVLDAGNGFRLQLREGTAAGGPAITLFTKVPLREAIAIYGNRGVAFDAEGMFRDPGSNALVLGEED